MSVLNGQVKARRFATVRLGGYDAEEVDRVVDELETSVRDGEETVTTLRHRLAMVESLLNEADADNAALRAAADACATAPAQDDVDPARTASQAAARLLEIATRDAEELLDQARGEAAGILAAAEQGAVRREQESAQRLAEAGARLDQLRAQERDGRQRLAAQLQELLDSVRGAEAVRARE